MHCQTSTTCFISSGSMLYSISRVAYGFMHCCRCSFSSTPHRGCKPCVTCSATSKSHPHPEENEQPSQMKNRRSEVRPCCCMCHTALVNAMHMITTPSLAASSADTVPVVLQFYSYDGLQLNPPKYRPLPRLISDANVSTSAAPAHLFNVCCKKQPFSACCNNSTHLLLPPHSSSAAPCTPLSTYLLYVCLHICICVLSCVCNVPVCVTELAFLQSQLGCHGEELFPHYAQSSTLCILPLLLGS